jgi:hypothetical protein
MTIVTLKSVLGLCLFSGLLIGTTSATFGQGTPGVSENEILIGSCSALEGPSHFLGVETVTGAKAYFHLINEEGGVNERKLKLISSDDSYDPAKTQACFDHLMSEKVFALGFFVGTPTAVKYVPMAESAKIPLVGLFTGAQILYTPLRHWIVNVRTSYFDETRGQVEGLKRAGKDLTREGLIHAIESIHDHALGLGPQLKLNYSAKEHKGFDHVIPTVVRGGRAVPFTDWSTVLSK